MLYTIKDILSPVEASFEKDIENKENKCYQSLLNALYAKAEPKVVFKKYFNKKDQESVYTELDNFWHDRFDNIHKTINYGRKISSMLVTDLSSYSLKKYIKKEFQFNIVYGSAAFMNFERDKFRKLAIKAVSLLYAKYSKIYLFEVKTVIVQVLFRYFKVYDQILNTTEPTKCNFIDYWIITPDDIITVIDDVLNTCITGMIADLKHDMECDILITKPQKTKKPEKIKPVSREDILLYVSIDATPEEKKEAVREHWPYYENKSDKTVSRVLKQFGLLRQYNKHINIEPENKTISLFYITEDFKISYKPLTIFNHDEACEYVNTQNYNNFLEFHKEYDKCKDSYEKTEKQLKDTQNELERVNNILNTRIDKETELKHTKKITAYLIGLLNEHKIPYDLNAVDEKDLSELIDIKNVNLDVIFNSADSK